RSVDQARLTRAQAAVVSSGAQVRDCATSTEGTTASTIPPRIVNGPRRQRTCALSLCPSPPISPPQLVCHQPAMLPVCALRAPGPRLGRRRPPLFVHCKFQVGIPSLDRRRVPGSEEYE